ncbi:type IX secretion system ring subunit PorN/GldN [Flavobacterium selenitireducens]|uniref:type IX secretion system ring protein PorN/GldN n=1 Tax=Flavobacterium selenitireducens TaxID=2722704 RepID=UPI00168B4900|nr:gliding motility protein GldN [Flavobacterium selenitireducens]MBD3583329.1 gliding motility protein GldN [Flavobacterium selenitireducens]
MKLRNLIVIVCAAAASQSFAQSNLLNAKTPDEIGKKTPAQMISDNDKPLPYGYVHDRDVLMGKTVWEYVDLDQRVNFPMYYPVDTANIGKDRRSLFNVLLANIQSGRITEVYADEYFNTKKTLKDMESVFTYIDTLDSGRDELNNNRDLYFPRETKAVVKKDKKGRVISSTPGGTVPAQRQLDPQYINKTELTPQDVKGYKIKGYWYFDKRQGEMKYRMLAICPTAIEARDIGKEKAEPIELFWVYFPSIREVLHEHKAFNERNSAMPISFDHLLNSRRFSGEIYKEENVYGDRQIADYMKDNAQMQLLESERIKDKIRDFEQDMWNY